MMSSCCTAPAIFHKLVKRTRKSVHGEYMMTLKRMASKCKFVLLRNLCKYLTGCHKWVHKKCSRIKGSVCYDLYACGQKNRLCLG